LSIVKSKALVQGLKREIVAICQYEILEKPKGGLSQEPIVIDNVHCVSFAPILRLAADGYSRSGASAGRAQGIDIWPDLDPLVAQLAPRLIRVPAGWLNGRRPTRGEHTVEPYPYEAEELEELAFQAQHDLGWGDPARAARYCEELARHWAEVDGPDSERALVWRSMWGRALTEARRYPEAEAVLSDLVVDRTRVLGCDAPGTLVARGNLARAVALGGRPREGILLAEQLLADRQRVLGLDHPSTLDTRGHLAHFHHHLGDHATAVRMFTNLLATRERVLGPDHEVTRQTNVYRINVDK